MKELFHVFGPEELFGADEALGIEVEAIPCQPGDNAKSSKGTLEIMSCDTLTEFSANQIELGDDPDRPAA
jgi:hypothetical protein